jgi:hypothetical protein
MKNFLAGLMLASVVIGSSPALAASEDQECTSPEQAKVLEAKRGYSAGIEIEDITDEDGHYDKLLVFASPKSDVLRMVWFNAGCYADYSDALSAVVLEYLRRFTEFEHNVPEADDLLREAQ